MGQIDKPWPPTPLADPVHGTPSVPDLEPEALTGWVRERRILLIITVLLVLTLVLALAFVAKRFEQDAAELYGENIHAVVAVSAARLEEVFLETKKLAGILAQSDIIRQVGDPHTRELLYQVLVALQDRGAMAVVLTRADKTIVVPDHSLGQDPVALISKSRGQCAALGDSVCIAHVAGNGKRDLIVVSGRQRSDPTGTGTLAGIVLDWPTVGNQLTRETKLDAWSKAFVLDHDGTLLAWPAGEKPPGFKVLDQEAGCTECHRDLYGERAINETDWQMITLEIDDDAYLVATAPAKVGEEKMTVGMVAPRSAAVARQGPVITWGVGLLLFLSVMVAFVIYRLHRLGTAQVNAIRDSNQRFGRLNEALEEIVRARTEQLQAAHERAREVQRTHAALDRQAAVGELAAVFAHEVRTPLNALSIARQRLARVTRRGEPIAPELANEVLESQRRNVEMINEYVESYLKYTRQARREVSIGVSTCDIATLTREVFSYVEPEARRAGVALRGGTAAGQVVIDLDAGTLRHILVNLVLNAVQVQPHGGEVVVAAELENGHVTVEVADRGPGVAAEHASEIFEPFRSYREGGTGLGLAICQRLAKAQNATVDFRGRPGGGAIFAVIWPVHT